MNEQKNNTKDNKLEFNTYCIFTEEKQSNTMQYVKK